MTNERYGELLNRLQRLEEAVEEIKAELVSTGKSVAGTLVKKRWKKTTRAERTTLAKALARKRWGDPAERQAASADPEKAKTFRQAKNPKSPAK